MNRKPILIDIDEDDATPSPAETPSVPELQTFSSTDGKAMRGLVTIAARRPRRLARLFWGLLTALVVTLLSISLWNFTAALLESNPTLGYVVTALVAALVLICVVLILRELASFARLAKIDKLRHAAETAVSNQDLSAARDVTARLERLYSRRHETKWGRDQLKEQAAHQLDAVGLLNLAEHEVMTPLDAMAEHEIEIASRQVATVTALVPLAFADVLAALLANLRMIRRIAEVYGARSGTFGTWRLARAVITHLVATGAVAIGDDMLGSIAGGGMLAKVSRRFGEGLVNGALTARVGLAAMQVCRPLPFVASKPSSVTKLVQRALTGVFSKDP
ncbi:MAG: TIGR01620 family protein [Pseudomonadota bacterium]